MSPPALEESHDATAFHSVPANDGAGGTVLMPVLYLEGCPTSGYGGMYVPVERSHYVQQQEQRGQEKEQQQEQRGQKQLSSVCSKVLSQPLHLFLSPADLKWRIKQTYTPSESSAKGIAVQPVPQEEEGAIALEQGTHAWRWWSSGWVTAALQVSQGGSALEALARANAEVAAAEAAAVAAAGGCDVLAAPLRQGGGEDQDDQLLTLMCMPTELVMRVFQVGLRTRTERSAAACVSQGWRVAASDALDPAAKDNMSKWIDRRMLEAPHSFG